MEAISDFSTLPLPQSVKDALATQGINTPTPIQSQAIPVAMQGKDVIGLAQTGTGKTLAFCLPLITALDKAENKDATALILAPTREIAIQVTEVIKKLTTEMKGRWTPLLVIGGVGMQPQIDGLGKKPRLIIATPGRLVDHMREGVAKLDTVSFLVLDEADRMLDMGFAPQLNEILRGLPSQRQTMLFSATFPREIEEIAGKYLRAPQRIESGAGHSKVVDTVTQIVKEMKEEEKFDCLIDALTEREGTIIVFVRTKHRTERIAKQLEKKNFSAGRIHGDRSQSQRQNTLNAFKDGTIRILVATDIAARGIDVANVAHVINYDIPNVPEEYIHRIGRTGRAGATGDAVTFVTPEVVEEWYDIQKLLNPEEARKLPRPRNAPKPDKPQQGQRPHRQHGQSNGGARDNGPRQDRPQRQEHRDNRGPAPQRSHRGPRPDNRYQQQARPSETRAHSGYEGEEDFHPQPTLEEQLTRIDREGRARNANRGGGGQHRSGPNNRHNNNNRPHSTNNRGGGKGGYQQDRSAAGPGNRSAPPAPEPKQYDDVEDNAGNREQSEAQPKKKGFLNWFKN